MGSRDQQSEGNPYPTIRSFNSRYGTSGLASSRYGGSTYDRYRSYYTGGIDSFRRPGYNFGNYKPKYGSWRDQIGDIDDDNSDENTALPATPETSPPEDDDIMADLHPEENKASHHSDSYGIKGTVLRRGQEFLFTLTMGKGHNRSNSRIMLQFATGDEPKTTRNTRVRINLEDTNLINEKWAAKVVREYQSKTGSQCLDISIMISATAIIGQYTMWVDIFPKHETDAVIDSCKKRYRITDDLFIIFNPWCKADQVYMSSEEDRQEYVLNETGRIYVGQESSIHGRPWNFGQFAKSCLAASLYLLEKSYLQKEAHGNATLVTRALSAMANSNDEDGGILTGNWSGDYRSGTSPTCWNGSVSILEEFMRFKRPVKYGQCWVFSGLLTTLMRAIGIPTRSVTNFESAHDHDYSMTIDNHMNTRGKPMRNLDDSVWNFHVWNESWFSRPDLPKNSKGESYDGWQAYDATPQEQSEGMMRCGPAPLKAIKEGNVYLGYDSKFIFAEVNGDRVTWLVDGAGDMMATNVDLSSVGKFISTKQPGRNEREDITGLYKHTEGSDAEREAVKRAFTYSSRKDDLRNVYDLDKNKDVTFDFTGNTFENGDIKYELHIVNTSSEKRLIEVRMTAAAKYYTGIPGEELSSKAYNLTLEAGQDKSLDWSARAHEYLSQLPDDACVCIYILAKVQNTGQIYTSQKTMSVEKPSLDVQVSKSKISKGEDFDVIISFTNPLDFDITSGCIRLEGPGVQKDKEILIKEFIKPGKTFSERVKLNPKYKGQREIIANFSSRQLTGITGAAEIEVV